MRSEWSDYFISDVDKGFLNDIDALFLGFSSFFLSFSLLFSFRRSSIFWMGHLNPFAEFYYLPIRFFRGFRLLYILNIRFFGYLPLRSFFVSMIFIRADRLIFTDFIFFMYIFLIGSIILAFVSDFNRFF